MCVYKKDSKEKKERNILAGDELRDAFLDSVFSVFFTDFRWGGNALFMILLILAIGRYCPAP